MSGLVKGTAVVALLFVASLPAQADVVYSNNFSTNQDGFVGGSIETSPSGESLLAHFQQSTTTLTITGLQANSNVSLSFTLDVIGSMDGNAGIGGGPGDFFNISLNGSQVFNYNFANYGPGGGNSQSYPTNPSPILTDNNGTNTLGYSGFPDGGNGVQDSIYNFNGTDNPLVTGTADATGTLVLVFSDLSNETYDNEHYGIDNVVVDGTFASVSTTPLPAALPMLASGLGVLGLLSRRKRKGS